MRPAYVVTIQENPPHFLVKLFPHISFRCLHTVHIISSYLVSVSLPSSPDGPPAGSLDERFPQRSANCNCFTVDSWTLDTPSLSFTVPLLVHCCTASFLTIQPSRPAANSEAPPVPSANVLSHTRTELCTRVGHTHTHDTTKYSDEPINLQI